MKISWEIESTVERSRSPPQPYLFLPLHYLYSSSPLSASLFLCLSLSSLLTINCKNHFSLSFFSLHVSYKLQTSHGEEENGQIHKEVEGFWWDSCNGAFSGLSRGSDSGENPSSSASSKIHHLFGSASTWNNLERCLLSPAPEPPAREAAYWAARVQAAKTGGQGDLHPKP